MGTNKKQCFYPIAIVVEPLPIHGALTDKCIVFLSDASMGSRYSETKYAPTFPINKILFPAIAFFYIAISTESS